MARVELDLPAPSSVSSGLASWNAANTDYGDISALSTQAVLILRNFFVDGSFLRVLLWAADDTSETPFDREDLSTEWATNANAITLRAPTLDDLVLPGPNEPNVPADTDDPTEPYDWRLSHSQWASAYNGSSAADWLSDFDALTAAQQASVTLILDDGVPVAEDHAVDAGAAAWSFALPEPEVTRTGPAAVDHAVNAGGVAWAFATPEPTVTRTAAPTVTLAAITFSSLADWQTHFSAPTGGTNRGYWQHDSGRSTSSGSTGPGTNNSNTFQFAYTETSGLQAGDDQLAMDNGVAEFVTVPAGTDRSVRLRVCLQGVFDDGEEGFSIESRPTGGTWTRQELIYGWAYSNARVDGGTFVDYDGETQDVVVDGGWIDRDIAIPDGHTEVRIAPTYLLVSLALRHDMALRSFEWFVGGAPPESTGADHAVDAGAASWAFALPQPSVTRTAPGPQDHAVDAGAASWAFALPEPAVTRTAPITQDHAVDAGAASWAFAVAVPRITTSGVSAALDVLVRGLHQDGVQQPSIRVRHSIAKTSTASFVLRGRLDAIPIPAYGDSVSIIDGSGETVFSGFVRAPDPEVSDFGGFLDRATVRCQGYNENLRYRVITGAEGVEIVEADHGADQFAQIVALLPGYTEDTDLDSNSVAIRTDVRYQTAGAALRALAVANDAILHVTTALEIRLFQRGNLPESALGRLDAADLFQIGITRDPRKVRSRQILRYGGAVAQRTINGDGSTRAFLVAGVQAPVDYMAAGVAARPLNAVAGDQGLRMRADAGARARTGGGIDFFGGAAGDPASGLYVGATLAGASGISLRMLTNGKLQLRAGVEMGTAARYGIALRNEGTGNPLWTSEGIAPTIETESGTPTRDEDADFTHPGFARHYAISGDTIFGLGADSGEHKVVSGFRVSGTVAVRDSRFDLTVPSGPGYDHGVGLVVLANVLQVVRYESGNVKSYACRINAGSLTRDAGLDWDFPAPGTSGTVIGVFTNGDNSKVWVARQTLSLFAPGADTVFAAYDNAANVLTRSAGDDLTFSVPSFAGNTYEFWRSGDYLFFISVGTVLGVGTGNNRLRRVSISTGVFDVGLSLGSRFDGRGGMFGFSGLLFSIGGRTSMGGVPGGHTSEMKAFRIATDYLEWDAPSSGYNILNSRRQFDAGFRVAVIDPDVIGASVPDAEFSPIPVDVRSVNRITLNGTQENLGDGQEWRFDVARQKLIQDPSATALTAADALVVDYAARGIAQACNPAAAVMRDAFADLRDSEGLASDDALATAEAFLDRYGTLTDRLSIEIRGNAEIAREAQTVQFDTAMLRALGLTDAADADRWLIYDVQFRWSGDVRLQRVECQRGEFRERAVDWWREREGDA